MNDFIQKYKPNNCEGVKWLDNAFVLTFPHKTIHVQFLDPFPLYLKSNKMDSEVTIPLNSYLILRALDPDCENLAVRYTRYVKSWRDKGNIGNFVMNVEMLLNFYNESEALNYKHAQASK